MHRGWGRPVVAVWLAVTCLLGVVLATQVVAAPVTLSGVTAKGRLNGDVYSVWYGQLDRQGICRLIAGCSASRGTAPDWVFVMKVDVPVVGVKTLDVKARITKQTQYKEMRLALSADSAVGGMTGVVQVTLTPRGAATEVAVRVLSATMTGAIAAVAPLWQKNLQPNLTYAFDQLNQERAIAAPVVAPTVKAAKPGSPAVVTVRVSAASMTARKPKAVGRLYVVVGGRQVCQAALKASTGSCRFAAPAKGVPVVAVAVGRFDNGYSLWASGTRRYGR